MADPLYGKQVMPSMTHPLPMTHPPPMMHQPTVTHPPPMAHPPPVTQPPAVQQSHDKSLTPPDSPTKHLYEVWAVPPQAVVQQLHEQAVTSYVAPTKQKFKRQVKCEVRQEASHQRSPSPDCQSRDRRSLSPTRQPWVQRSTSPRPPVWAVPPQAVAGLVQQGGQEPAGHYQSLIRPAVSPPPEPEMTATKAIRELMTQPPPVLQPSVVPKEPTTLAQAGVGVEFIELNSYNAANFVAQHGDILLDGYPTQWHKITINTPVLESKRKFVISAINKLLTPMKLIPYFFRMENNRITFHVNLCGAALKSLCRRNLKVPYISDKFVEIEMTVTLFSKYLNILETMEKIVARRLDSQEKFLDLSDINSIPEVRKMLFDPTDNWHILEQLLTLAQVRAPELTTLALAGNGIVETTSFWNLLASNKWLALRTLDLSDNEIESTCELSLSRTWAISEVYLDRNPICSYLDRSSYISAVRVTFPCITKLDGTYLHTTARLPYWKPNFIVASAGDSGEFADQFIEHFFTLYDAPDRMKLHGLYHKKACFSMKFPFYTGSRMNYGDKTRNLLRCFDRKEARAALTRGSEKILKRLSKLPKTQHDPYTFAVDLTVHTPKLTVLTVTGVFRDFTKDKRTHRHFSRTFVLTGRGNGEYQITNDILFISNATDRETQEAFKFVTPPKEKKYRPTSNLSDFDKEYMIIQVQLVTNMSAQWSRKCLEDTNWDLKEALEIFVELYKTRKIPKSAFSMAKTVERKRPRF